MGVIVANRYRFLPIIFIYFSLTTVIALIRVVRSSSVTPLLIFLLLTRRIIVFMLFFILLILIEYLSVIIVYIFITSRVGFLSPSLILVIFAFIFERVLYSCILITHEE